jgi:hypothetical protein
VATHFSKRSEDFGKDCRVPYKDGQLRLLASKKWSTFRMVSDVEESQRKWAQINTNSSSSNTLRIMRLQVRALPDANQIL